MKQITIVSDDRPGLLAEISTTLAAKGINIETLDAEGIDAHGVIILTVDRYDEALAALRDARIPAMSEDAILIRIPDEPGALAKIFQRFRDADISLRSARIVRRQADYGLVALSADRTEEALDLVRDVLVA